MNTEPPQDTRAAALAWHRAGVSVVRVATDGTKRPLGAWRQHQQHAATAEQLTAWFEGGHPGIGVVCGAVSDGLEMLEFEGRAVDEGLLKEFTEIAEASDLGELWQRLTSGYLERSPSGGIHLLYKVTGIPVPGNTKLAKRPARDDELTDSERAVLTEKPGKVFVRDLVETRGEGGFVVVAPSRGPVHETGRPYDLLAGNPATLPVIDGDEHRALHTIARMLDTPSDDVAKVEPGFSDPAQDAFFRSGPDTDTALKPGEDYEARTDWTHILQPHGWQLLGARGHTRYWRRPGKDRGVSATTGHADDRDRLYVFSSSTEFDTERPYTKFGAYAVLEHGGNHTDAARALKRSGYGAQATPRHLTAVPAQRITPASAPPIDGTAALKPDEPIPRPTGGSWPESFTDDGNALLFVDTYGEHLRYVPQRSMWLTWEGHRWVWDEGALVVEQARDLARTLDPDVFADNEDLLKAARRHKAGSLSRDKIGALLSLARSDRRVVTPIDRLDGHRLKLNTPGGIVDLLTGQLTPSDPDEMHTRATAVAPDPDMPTPIWNQFIADTFNRDAEITAFAQRLAGYSASGDVRHHVLPFLFGAGQNGKSVLMDVVRHLLGDYATTAPPGFLMAGKNEHAAEVARLQGMRLVVASEVNQGARFDEAKIKELTGGDTLTARFMRQDFFTFEPTHHLWLMGNHQPEVRAGGDSFWRRLRMVPFLHRVPDDKKIENLSDLLVNEEGPGILAWIVAGAVDVFAHGLGEPASVMAATRAYADEEDEVGRFLEECCLRAEHASGHVRVEMKRLYAAYESWAHAEGGTPMKKSPFGRELKARGVTDSKSGSKRFYDGLSLLSHDDEGDDPRWP